jgi:hypothetical protein
MAVLLETMPAEDATDLRAALDDPTIMGTAIAKVLRSRGHDITHDTVQRHRRGQCSCQES